MVYSDNFKLFPGAKSFGAWEKEAKERGINLNPTLNDIATEFWGDRKYGFGKSSSTEDPTSHKTADEMLEMISREGSGSGVPPHPINPLPTPPQATQPTGNPPSTPSSEKLTSEDVNTGIALSTINGMQNQPSQSDSYALIRQLSDQYQNADPMTQTLMDAIYSYQNDYANATTDEARQLAHAGAERAREIARINELDLGLMSNGENLSPEQSNLAMVNAYLNQLGEAQKKFQSVQDNLANNYSESSNDHFWRLYDEYRQQGDSDRIAAIKAGRETTGYQQERVQSLQSAIDDYGIEGGVMNQFGVSLLGQLADEDNIMGSAYANAYAMPLRNYQDNQELIKMAIQHDYNIENNEIQHAHNIERDTTQAGLQKYLYGYQHDLSEAGKDADVKRYGDRKDIDLAYQKELADYTKSLQDRSISEQIEMREKFAEKYNLPEDVKIGYILTGNLISKNMSRGRTSGGGTSDGGYDKDWMDGMNKTVNSLRSQIEDERKYLETLDPTSDEYARTQNNINRMRNQLTRTYKAMDLLNGTAIQRGDYIKGVLNGRKITGNWNNDAAIVADFNDFFYALGTQDPEYSSLNDPANRQKAVKKVLMAYGGYTEENANRAVGITTAPAETPKSESKSEEKKPEQSKTSPVGIKTNPYNGQIIAKAANPQVKTLDVEGKRFNPQTGKWEEIKPTK